MTKSELAHFTFTVERRIDAPPAAVFKAWSDAEAKARWFAGDDGWRQTHGEFDFRVGGQERLAGAWRNSKTSDFVALYRDIVANQRIVYVYDMHVNGEKISVSLATIEIAPAGDGAIMKVTEQGAYFVGGEEAHRSREEGANWLMDKLAASLAGKQVEN